ncbi:hypothetical protein VTK73DRAFT_7074 [Phialemonium thermophilum]|uniref:Uncharacterized protein n=1 Tax=Phialemonium thermophilum TaxID=223376 RepID=A0ABR3WGL7_9PEZI
MSGSIKDVDSDHYEAFATALTNLLHTSIAEHTYAEIIDGLPTADTWYAYHGIRHDIIEAHRELCPGALETARHFRADLQPKDLAFDPTILEAYGESPLGSRTFKLRLIELLAVACHDLAALLHQKYDEGFHKGAHAWTPPNVSEPRWQVAPPPPRPPTVFFHAAYDALDQYPRGVADMVGYWAESRVFGKVVLFDRGEDETGCHDVFIYPNGGRRLIFQPSEEQVDRLYTFLTTPASESKEIPSPLPLVPEKYARRVDPWDAFASLHIFRDRYERRRGPRPRGHLVALEDDPQGQDLLALIRERYA